MDNLGFNTALLHKGGKKRQEAGATLIPIYQSSAFSHESAETLERIFENKAAGFSYTRINNPTIEAFENKITMLEGGIGSVACASGMAALTNAFLNILQAGDEIAAAPGLYGGTIDLFRDFEAFGIKTRYARENTPQAFEEIVNERTKLIFAETIGNPKLDITDIPGLSEVAHKHNLPLIIDNTTATAFLVKPLFLGADIVVSSSSKYINGNSDAISGILTDGGTYKWTKEKYPGLEEYLKLGKMAYIAKLRKGLFRNTGACLSPQNAFLNCIGLETLGLRMERQCENALKLAKFLEELGADITVNYPGLENSPYHELAKRQLKNGYGAIITFRAGSKERAFHIINSLKLPLIISNVGDTKTLVIHPASTISLHCTDEEKNASGVYQDLIRVSVGIENIEDLKADFENALLGGE
ncbi:O-acetylhomoserine aminocarboxypropyltransferase/cysteine synthase family protein [Konateibacter massiliensis]|uniref:O-acetylhomoserine aminocarboxypropyltransferase/cysteine synthase family protein n=1 Tax=Konateibacter massiliensis TaxID=2002841 RepID=UPI000C15532B|nr:aminotransferase class I/II-fold pyridoxal phosphate-dependent enzyme [Konateibacter massiliensis]